MDMPERARSARMNAVVARPVVHRSVAVVLLVMGCQNKVRDPAPSRHTEIPCTPVIHAAEARRGPPMFEGYRFLGASSDGKRVAFMVTHMGPGSGQPVGGAHVAEAGAEREVLAKSYFNITGTEADLPKVEQGITTEYADELAAAGVEVGKHVPAHQLWCTDSAGHIFTDAGTQLELRVSHDPCESDSKHQSVSWQVCTKGGSQCARGPKTGCIDGDATVLDLLRAGNVDWIVVDVLTKPFPDSEFHLFQVAGSTFSGS